MKLVSMTKASIFLITMKMLYNAYSKLRFVSTWFLLSIYTVDTNQSYCFHLGTNWSKWMVILHLSASKCSFSMWKFYSNNFVTLYQCFSNTIRLPSSSKATSTFWGHHQFESSHIYHTPTVNLTTPYVNIAKLTELHSPILDKINLEVFLDLHTQLEQEEDQLNKIWNYTATPCQLDIIIRSISYSLCLRIFSTSLCYT